jgi:hypothetical protein
MSTAPGVREEGIPNYEGKEPNANATPNQEDCH